MYSWIWRKLPFGLPGKISGSVVLAATVGLLLWYVVFPWATPLLPFDDVQVESGTEQQQQQDSEDGAVIPGEEDAPDEIPYDVHSNEPHPDETAGN